MTESATYLLVHAGGRPFGLGVEDVLEVRDPGEVAPVPALAPAMRGVESVPTGIVPVLHLAALLDGAPCPDARGATLVIARLGERYVGLEVDAADVVRREPLLAPGADALPWVRAIASGDDGYVPLLDLSALEARLTESVS